MMLHLYGIPNCDTVKKARTWLDNRELTYSFHNFKMEKPTKSMLKQWCRQAGWQKLVNKQSSTWRALSAEQQAAITDANAAVAVMQQQPSIIKRPVVTDDGGNVLTVGFQDAGFADLLR